MFVVYRLGLRTLWTGRNIRQARHLKSVICCYLCSTRAPSPAQRGPLDPVLTRLAQALRVRSAAGPTALALSKYSPFRSKRIRHCQAVVREPPRGSFELQGGSASELRYSFVYIFIYYIIYTFNVYLLITY
jgi:hypothetical protein